MNPVVNVARLHLVDRFSITWLCWGILALTFAINAAIFAVVPVTQPEGNFTGALVTIFIFMIVVGVQAATKVLPLALTFGVSRRSYYSGTVALVGALCVLYSAALTVLWALEGITNGWGLQMHFFRVPWILDGPWAQVFLTTLALMLLVFLFGMWSGLIYRKYKLLGSVVFLGSLAVLLTAAILVISWRQWWPQVGAFLADLDIIRASVGVLVAAAICGAGGYLTIRRLAV